MSEINFDQKSKYLDNSVRFKHSEDDDDLNFKNGNIISLSLYNFQTFKEQHFNFGPALNLIAAPNGSGKSSLANALAFIFNGTTKTIGKSKNISDFIRHGTKCASIEAVVYSKTPINILKTKKPNRVYLKREIISNDKVTSNFYIDGKLTTCENYLKFINNLKIDCNNLTNFLPQERVSEFTQMSGVELFNEVYQNIIVDNPILGNKNNLSNNELEDFELLKPDRIKKLIDDLYEKQNAIDLKENDIFSKSKVANLINSTINTLQTEMEKIKQWEENSRKIRLLEYKSERIKYEDVSKRHKEYKDSIKIILENLKNYDYEINQMQIKISEFETNLDLKNYKNGEAILKDQNNKLNEINNQIKNICMEIEVKEAEKSKIFNKNLIIKKENENLKRQQIENLNKKREIEEQILKTSEEILNSLKSPNNYGNLIPQESFTNISKLEELENKIKNMKKGNSPLKLRNLIDEIEKILPSTKPVYSIISQFDNQIKEIQTFCKELQFKIEDLEKKKINFATEKNKRMEMLKRFHLDTFKAVMILREKNIGIEFLEPAFLHLNIQNNYQTEIENLLGFQVLSSFIVFNQQDLLKMTRKLKDEMKLSVNFIQIDKNETIKFYSKEICKKLNFDGFAIDLVIANDYYKKMLCTYSSFHTTPISKNEVDEDLILKNIPNCATIVSNGKVNKISRNIYNSEKTYNSYLLKSRGLFKLAYDIGNIDNQLNEFNLKRKNFKNKLDKILLDKKEYENAMNTMVKNYDITALRSTFYGLERVDQKLSISPSKLIEFDENKFIELNEEMKKLQKFLIKELEVEKIPIVNLEKVKECRLEHENLLRQFGLKSAQKRDIEKEIDVLKQQKEKSKELSLEIANKIKSLEKREDEIIEKKKENEIKAGFAFDKKEKDSTKEFVVSPIYNFRDEIKNLPNDLAEISAEILSYQSKNDFLDPNGSIRKEYSSKETEFNKTKSEIERLQDDRRSQIIEHYKLKKKINSQIQKYLEPVNCRFKNHFAKFGFEGEIKLHFQSGEEDGIPAIISSSQSPSDSAQAEIDLINNYKSGKFALNIFVKFRKDETAVKLSSSRHSGGEKSVSTVLFLLSLQNINTPFRLVDEINQGMDQANERKVFEVLKGLSNESQFFIITPKLIENLEFSDNTRAIILYSSKGIKQLEEYSKSKLVIN